MAKTLMISNEVYHNLKEIKHNKSFSELLKYLLEKNRIRKGADLKQCLGLIPEDKELEKLHAEAKRGWKKWTSV